MTNERICECDACYWCGYYNAVRDFVDLRPWITSEGDILVRSIEDQLLAHLEEEED